jgi:DNA-binding MarR family transcriptional regulator
MSHGDTFERGPPVATRKVTEADYERLLAFRTGLRTFLAWSKREAAKAGLAPSQHQLLLAIRGHPDHERGPTVGDVAGYLLVKPNSAAELAARAERAGLVNRVRDPVDARRVRLRLTPLGNRKIASITAMTLEELRRLGPPLQGMWEGLE